ncbi:5'/3'-nucleotidase SurE [Paludibacter sp. 221]|nr:5'/3'-nucleotidase SurE [Paludibacter sp. 221]
MNKPLILVTNDDGVDSKGIKVLSELMAELGDVVVLGPAFPHSGQSNALTVTAPIRFKKVDETGNITRYSCTGTPTDCVKLALNELLCGRKPDLLVSGINHGSNAAINVIYSGTMGAAFEGCENGIPSIGFSITDHSMNADFNYFRPYVLNIARQVLEQGFPSRVCLNVNAPMGEIKGVKLSRQCDGYWTEEFDKRNDPRGNGNYYWLTGYFKNAEPDAQDTDEWALANGYISVVPTRIDMTDYTFMEELKKWNFDIE